MALSFFSLFKWPGRRFLFLFFLKQTNTSLTPTIISLTPTPANQLKFLYYSESERHKITIKTQRWSGRCMDRHNDQTQKKRTTSLNSWLNWPHYFSHNKGFFLIRPELNDTLSFFFITQSLSQTNQQKKALGNWAEF